MALALPALFGGPPKDASTEKKDAPTGMLSRLQTKCGSNLALALFGTAPAAKDASAEKKDSVAGTISQPIR